MTERRFRVRHIPGPYYSAENLGKIAGRKRLFGKPPRGWMIYAYNEQAPGWALHRRWNFGLFCVHHVGPGKATDPEGWHITFAGLYRTNCCRRLTWRWADTFKTGGKTGGNNA